MKRISEEEKQNIINSYKSGESVASISMRTEIPRSTIYGWIKAEQPKSNELPVNKTTINNLERTGEKQKAMVEVLQKAFDVESIPIQIRLSMLEELYSDYNVHVLCDALKVPRGTFYNHIKRNKRDNTWYAKRREELREQIEVIYHESRQIYGAKKIAAVLRERGIKTSEVMVRELMTDMGLISIREDAKDYYDKEKQKHKNYLNQQFHASRPNEVWVSDVTFFRYNEKSFYICVIIDLFARKVVAYRISYNNSTQLTKSTFKSAYESRQPIQPLLFHTDNGSNYKSRSFMTYLKGLGVTQSFSRPHVPYDNSVMESFFSNMKREELYRTKYRSEKELRAAVDAYIKFYNGERPHSKNQYKTPDRKEAEYYSKQAKN